MSANIIIGRNAVRQHLQSNQHIEKLYLRDRQSMNDGLRQIIQTAKKQRIQIQWLAPHRFDDRFEGDHQGIACITHGFSQQTVADICRQMPPVVVMLDHLNDPHNFGAICRTAEAFGVSNIIYPKNRAVQLTPSAVKAAAGATENLSFSQVTNLRQSLDQLKDAGYWIYAASSNIGDTIEQAQFNRPMVLICGSEESGISPGLKKTIDSYVHIPMRGKTSSLNVSVATGIILAKIAFS
ncbi:MAG: 23S rRNA (guanosine(2251)-2'-O)-methyltransferase RlmB [Candidatus Marinamargulisbacteria bacterium]